MVRKTNWSRRFVHSIAPLDGERMVELQDVVTYMLAIGDRHHRRAWQRGAALLLEAAERNGSVDAVRRQVSLRASDGRETRRRRHRAGGLTAQVRLVRLACAKCERRGQYRKATLIEHYGPPRPMGDLRLTHWLRAAQRIGCRAGEICPDRQIARQSQCLLKRMIPDRRASNRAVGSGVAVDNGGISRPPTSSASGDLFGSCAALGFALTLSARGRNNKPTH